MILTMNNNIEFVALRMALIIINIILVLVLGGLILR